MYAILVIIIGLLCSASYAESYVVQDLETAIMLSQDTKMPILLVFGADWCEHCKILKDDLTKGEYGKELDKYIVCYLNVDEHKKYKAMYNVKALPDSRILVDQKETKHIVGYNKKKYKEWLSNDK
jgi:thioredoxin-like negative regulator of GroEL